MKKYLKILTTAILAAFLTFNIIKLEKYISLAIEHEKTEGVILREKITSYVSSNSSPVYLKTIQYEFIDNNGDKHFRNQICNFKKTDHDSIVVFFKLNKAEVNSVSLIDDIAIRLFIIICIGFVIFTVISKIH